MAILEISYAEIVNSNLTGRKATIYDDSGIIVACFRNFEPQQGQQFSKQTDLFRVPTVETAIQMILSNANYYQVPLSKYELFLNLSISSSYTSETDQISTLSDAGLITARLSTLSDLIITCNERRVITIKVDRENEEKILLNIYQNNWPGKIKTI